MFLNDIMPGSISGVGSIFGKRGQKKYGAKRQKNVYCPPANFADRADFRVGFEFYYSWQWHLTK